MNLKQTSRTFGDETAIYSVELSKEYTVKEFVDEVVSNKSNWGRIGIASEGAIFGNPMCEYKWGKLLTELPSEIMTDKVISAEAHGGWTMMDFKLTIQGQNNTGTMSDKKHNCCSKLTIPPLADDCADADWGIERNYEIKGDTLFENGEMCGHVILSTENEHVVVIDNGNRYMKGEVRTLIKPVFKSDEDE